MSGVTLGDLARDLEIAVDDLAGIAWSLGIAIAGPVDRLSPDMAQAIRVAALAALAKTAEQTAVSESASPVSVASPASSGPEGAASSVEPQVTVEAGPSCRVYELAAEYGVTPEVVLEAAHRAGIEVEGHLSWLADRNLSLLRTHLAMNPPKTFAEEQLRDGVRRRKRLRPRSSGEET